MTRAECVSVRLHEGEKLCVDKLHLDILYTPGHTDDSYSFLLSDRVFTGDTQLIPWHGANRLSERRSSCSLRQPVRQAVDPLRRYAVSSRRLPGYSAGDWRQPMPELLSVCVGGLMLRLFLGLLRVLRAPEAGERSSWSGFAARRTF
jgi:hypothetical protein